MASALNLHTQTQPQCLHLIELNTFVSMRVCVCVLLGHDQVDFPHVHQLGPALHRGCADVWDHAGQRRVLIRGHNDQHADGVAVVRQLDDPVFQSLGCGGHA